MAWKGHTSDVTVSASAISTVETITINEGAEVLKWQISNRSSGGQLSDFAVQRRTHPSGEFYDVASDIATIVTSDYITPLSYPLDGVDGSPNSLEKDSTAVIEMQVRGINAVRFRAQSGNSSDATVDTYWQVR